MVNCVVSQCKSCYGKSANGEKISFHKFPMAKKLRMEWEKQIGRRNLKCSIQSVKTARLCSLHFTDDCYSVSRTTATSMGHTLLRWKLKDDAVPTLFNNEPGTDSVESVKGDPKMQGREKEKRISTQDDAMQPDKPFSNVELQVEKVMNDKTIRAETGSQSMSDAQRSCLTSKVSPENKLTSSRNGVLDSEPETAASRNEKGLTFDAVEKESNTKTDAPLSNLKVPSVKETCSEDHANSRNHAGTSCQKCEPLTNYSVLDVSSEEIHKTHRGASKELAYSVQKHDISKKDSLLLCETCGIYFFDEIQFNNHSASCDPGDNKFMDSSIKSSAAKSQTESNEKNGQKDKVAEASNVIQVCLSDYENRFVSTFFICVCGFAASSSVELVAHSSSHAVERVFVCSVCSSVYQSILLLQQHVHKSKHYWTLEGKLPSPKSEGKLEPRSTSIPAPGIISQPTPHSNFLGTLSSQTHDYSSDGKVGAMDLTINGLEHVGVPLKCDYCPFSSFSARDLLNHRKMHLPSFAKKSEDESKQSDAIDTKPNSFAKDQGLLKCDSCGYSTRSAIELLQHKTYHSSEGPFKCNTCSYATISAIDLLQHKKDQSCLNLSKQC